MVLLLVVLEYMTAKNVTWRKLRKIISPGSSSCKMHAPFRHTVLVFLAESCYFECQGLWESNKKIKIKSHQMVSGLFFSFFFYCCKIKIPCRIKKKKSLNFFLISWLKHEDGKGYGAGANPHYCTHASSSRFNCFKTLSYAIDQTSEISNLVWLVECWNPCCKWSQIS